jgi:hypothetical protein
MKIEQLKTYHAGRPIVLKAVQIGGTTITIHGSILKTARLHDDWFTEVKTPTDIAAELRHERLADLFTFWHLFPEPSSAQHDFRMEPVALSALPIASHDHWTAHQITKEVRKNIKKAARRGVEVRRVEFNDDFVAGITRIFNEAPIRQRTPFWHYGKGFDQVKAEMGQDLDRSDFIGAYFEGELIGFYKFICGKNFAQPVVSISMLKHRDKYTDTALISEAVRYCSQRGLRYLTYGEWRRDSHREFLESHGFEQVIVPRYHIPLTFTGSMFLKTNLHLGWKNLLRGSLPEPVLNRLYGIRSRWYRSRLGAAPFETAEIAKGSKGK